MNNVWIMAQDTGDGVSSVSSEPIQSTSDDAGTTLVTGSPADPNGATPPVRQNTSPISLWFMAAMFVLMYFILFRGPKKKEQQHQKMLQALKKNDRVRTSGGILGTVIDVKDGEVVLKVDESTNTKIRLSASAIVANLSKENE